MLSRRNSAPKRKSTADSTHGLRKITFPLVSGNDDSSNPVIIKAKISRRQVNRVYMDSISSCVVIYEQCFRQLKPSIRSLRVDSKVPLVDFSGEHSWPLVEVPLEITIGEGPFERTKVLNFVIVRTNSLHNLILRRTAMQNMGIVVFTIHRAIKFHTPEGVGTVLSTYEHDKTGEGQKKLKETSQEATKDILGCMNAIEEVVINDKYPNQIVVIRRQLPTSFKKRLRDLLKANTDIFAWTYSDMTRIPRTIMVGGRPLITEHRLNELKHIEPRKQKKRGLAPERSESLHKEVEELTNANILREVKYQTWQEDSSIDAGGRRSLPEHERVHRNITHCHNPNQRRNPVMYLAVSEESISAVLLAERRKKQIPIYFAIELGDHDIEFKGRNSIKGQILVDFLVEILTTEIKEKETQNARNEELDPENIWKLYTDKASSSDGSRSGMILVNPKGREYTYALRFEFETTNNEAEYEALLAGPRIAEETKIEDLDIFIDSQLIANQVKGLFEARQLVINQYLEKTKEILKSFKSYSMEHLRQDQNKKAYALRKIASMTFSKLAKEVLVEVLHENSIVEKEATNIIKEEGENYMALIREYLLLGKLPSDTVRYGNIPNLLPETRYTSSLHLGLPPQVNGHVKVTNRDIVKGMEQSLGRTHQDWVDELPQVLWIHRTTLKSNNKETPFSLVYGLKAIVPIEISVETKRIKEFKARHNEKKRREDLNILEERREIASIREAYFKQKLERYYNKRIRPTTF
ncbi:reverse transcriptase domain-containing protein [Tanacetum coccineum]